MTRAEYRPFWSRAELEQLEEMREQGLNAQEIAEKLGRTKTAVQVMLSRLRDYRRLIYRNRS